MISKLKTLQTFFQGKEFETRLKEKKPGNLSDELRTALGMPLGHVSLYTINVEIFVWR